MPSATVTLAANWCLPLLQQWHMRISVRGHPPLSSCGRPSNEGSSFLTLKLYTEPDTYHATPQTGMIGRFFPAPCGRWPPK